MTLTKEQKIELLMLKDSQWKRYKRDAVTYFKTPDNVVPAHLEILKAMTYQQWLDIKRDLDTLRDTKKDVLEPKRKQYHAAKAAESKREYMRNYMRKRRGQGTAEGSGGDVDPQ